MLRLYSRICWTSRMGGMCGFAPLTRGPMSGRDRHVTCHRPGPGRLAAAGQSRADRACVKSTCTCVQYTDRRSRLFCGAGTRTTLIYRQLCNSAARSSDRPVSRATKFNAISGGVYSLYSVQTRGGKRSKYEEPCPNRSERLRHRTS